MTRVISLGAAGALLVRSPRGAIVPAYHYDTERALKCAFPECGAVLTGKKSETASHMRSHFLQAAGETLECPWPAEGDGESEGAGEGEGELGPVAGLEAAPDEDGGEGDGVAAYQ